MKECRSTGRFAEKVHQFGKFGPGILRISAFDGVGDAMIGMRFQNLILHLPQSRLDGVDLGKNVDAVAVFLHHAGKTAHLALDPVQALSYRRLESIVHKGYIPPMGI